MSATDVGQKVSRAAAANSAVKSGKAEAADDVFAPVARALGVVRQRAQEARSFQGAALAERLGRIAAQLNRPPLIAVVGEFNAGKSTLINRLLGVEALPTDVVPTTARPARLQYGARTGLVLHRRDGRQELRAIEDLLRYAHKGDARADSLGLADVASLDVFLPAESLRSFELLDTPGISDPEQDVEDTLRAIEQADAVIWCSMATQAWKDSEASFWARLPGGVKRTAFLVITGADRLNTEEEATRVLLRVAKETRGTFGAVLLTNLRPSRSPDEDGSGLAALTQAVAEQVVARGASLRAASALRAAEAAIADVQRDQEAALARSQELFDAIDRASRHLSDSWSRTERDLRTILASAEKAFVGQYDDAAKRAASIVETKSFTVPEEYIDEGVFTDDYKVRSVRCSMEVLDWDRIDAQHNALKRQTSKIVSSARKSVTVAVESFTTAFEETLLPLLDQLHPGHGSSSGLVQQHGQAVASVLEHAWHRVLGSLEGGGLHYAAAWQEREQEDGREFPTGHELHHLLLQCLSFDAAASLCREEAQEALVELSKAAGLLVEGGKRAARVGETHRRELRKELEKLSGPLKKLDVAR